MDYLSVLDVTQQPSLWQHRRELLKYPVRLRYVEVNYHSDTIVLLSIRYLASRRTESESKVANLCNLSRSEAID